MQSKSEVMCWHASTLCSRFNLLTACLYIHTQAWGLINRPEIDVDQRFSNVAAERLQARVAPEEAADLPLVWAPASWEPYLQTYMRGIRQFRLKETAAPGSPGATGAVDTKHAILVTKESVSLDKDKVASASWYCCGM